MGRSVSPEMELRTDAKLRERIGKITLIWGKHS
jgi:hypothetical protein